MQADLNQNPGADPSCSLDLGERLELANLLKASGMASDGIARESLCVRIGADRDQFNFMAGTAQDFCTLLVERLHENNKFEILFRLCDQIQRIVGGTKLRRIIQLRQKLEACIQLNESVTSGDYSLSDNRKDPDGPFIEYIIRSAEYVRVFGQAQVISDQFLSDSILLLRAIGRYLVETRPLKVDHSVVFDAGTIVHELYLKARAGLLDDSIKRATRDASAALAALAVILQKQPDLPRVKDFFRSVMETGEDLISISDSIAQKKGPRI